MRPDVVQLLRCPRSGQPLELVPLATGSADDVTFGFLQTDHFRYPIIEGIPVLLTETGPLCDLIDEGRYREACVTAAFDQLDRRRSEAVVRAAASIPGLSRATSHVAHWSSVRRREQDVRALYGEPSDHRPRADPLRLLYLDHRHPSAEGFLYFRYRFGLPRYLVSLALVDALRLISGPVIDVGCGGGHLAWAITQRTRHPVVGVDPSFAQLLAARRIAPAATFVCADGRAVPVSTGGFDLAVSSDVLPYVSQKATVVNEMIRTMRPGGILLLTALRNAGHEHVHGGEPLGPAEWTALTGQLAHTVPLSDDGILDQYLARRAPGSVVDADVGQSQTMSIVASDLVPALDDAVWDRWPHAVGGLRVHPLLHPVGAEGGTVRFERRLPTRAFEVDNPHVLRYLPAECVIPHDVLLHPSAEHTAAVDGLLERVALLGMPNPAPAVRQ